MSVNKPEIKRLGIAIVGCGIVGGGTAQVLLENSQNYLSRLGLQLDLVAIVDKNLSHAREIGLPQQLLHEDLDPVLKDKNVDVIVELVGGTGFARDLIKLALTNGKHVVTANKALLAHHGSELFEIARQNGLSIAFEASCAGGIPIVRALYDGLAANTINALFGIVNGTCNFILTEMISKGASYSSALADAQKAGFAEADPSLDVQGHDASHKIAILAGLAFGSKVQLEQVSVKGIDSLDYQDVSAGVKLGYVIKLIAQAQRSLDGIFVRVEPAFISHSHPLAWVSGSFNALSVYGSAVGHTLYYGRGAGARPTASAIVSDLISIALGSYPIVFKQVNIWSDRSSDLALVGDDKIIRRYYLRLNVHDKPGSLATVTAVLGSHQLSVASIHQAEIPENQSGQSSTPLVIILHPASEMAMNAAVAQINSLPAVSSQAVLIPILDEHPEFTS